MLDFLSHLERLSHPCVRDLAWAIGAPPSMCVANNPLWIEHHQFGEWFFDGLSWFERLDQDPTELVRALQRPGQFRLGLYFERLIAFWIEHASPYRLLAKNLQIQGEGRTIGEFDFLVDSENGPEHWEVAIKYYLGVQAGSEWHHWLGPNQRDRLSTKLNRMLDHQAKLSRTHAGAKALRTLNIEDEPTVRLWFKGHFFTTPSIEQTLPHGSTAGGFDRWLESGEIKAYAQEAAGDARWIIRHKPDWLCPLVHVGQHALNAEQLTRMARDLDRPIMLSECAPMHTELNLEVRRIFIVPAGWTERARRRLNEQSLDD